MTLDRLVLQLLVVLLAVMASRPVKPMKIQATPFVGKDLFRRNKITQMMQHSWHNYTGTKDLNYLVSCASTLHIMDLEVEYEQAIELITTHIETGTDFSSIDLIANWASDALGGLLSAHAMTEDGIFREKICLMMNRTVPMVPNEGIPKLFFDTDQMHTLVGGYLFEACNLNKVTVGWSPYPKLASGIRAFVRKHRKSLNFANDMWNATLDDWTESYATEGPRSVLQYRIHDDLLRMYQLSNGTDREIAGLLEDCVSSAFISIRKLDKDRYYIHSNNGRMYHCSCSMGAFLALLPKVRGLDSSSTEGLMRMAEGITQTCRDASVQAGHIDPSFFTVNPESGAITTDDKQYLGYSTVQSYFVLWRLTHNEKYRTWAWDTVIGLEKSSRRINGYAASDGEQWFWFTGATLKYLYLLFSDDDDLSLDEWVFSRCGHPFAIST